MNENLNPVTESVEMQPTVLTEAGSQVLIAESPVTLNLDNAVGELVGVVPTTEQFNLNGDVPSLDLSNLTDEQRSQLKEFQKRMEMYNASRSGHKAGDTHKVGDTSYLVSKTGAYQRLTPRVSRKATHRKEVASRRAGKS